VRQGADRIGYAVVLTDDGNYQNPDRKCALAGALQVLSGREKPAYGRLRWKHYSSPNSESGEHVEFGYLLVRVRPGRARRCPPWRSLAHSPSPISRNPRAAAAKFRHEVANRSISYEGGRRVVNFQAVPVTAEAPFGVRVQMAGDGLTADEIERLAEDFLDTALKKAAGKTWEFSFADAPDPKEAQERFVEEVNGARISEEGGCEVEIVVPWLAEGPDWSVEVIATGQGMTEAQIGELVADYVDEAARECGGKHSK